MAESARRRVASAQAGHPARRFESRCLRFTMRRRSIRQDARLLPGGCWFEPSRRSLITPRSSSGSRMPVSHTGDAGSNPARGLRWVAGVPPPRALGRVWRRGLAVSRVRRVRFPSRALLAVAQWTSTTLLPWPTGVRLLPARLRRKASSEPSGRDPDEQGAIPWRRPSCSRAGIRRVDSCRSDPRLRRGRSLKAAASPPQLPHHATHRDANGYFSATTMGRLGRRRSDTAVRRGSIPRSSTTRSPAPDADVRRAARRERAARAGERAVRGARPSRR